MFFDAICADYLWVFCGNDKTKRVSSKSLKIIIFNKSHKSTGLTAFDFYVKFLTDMPFI